MAINKTQIKTRLLNEGRFGEFTKVRDAFRAQGRVGNACWEAALDAPDSTGRTFGTPLPSGMVFTPGNGASMPPAPVGVHTPAPAASRASAPPKRAEGIPADTPVATAADFEGKPRGDHRAAVEWVAEHLHIDGVQPIDAPSGLAWSLLLDCKTSIRMREQFWTNLFSRMLPSDKEMKYLDRRSSENDDTRDAEALYEQAEKEQLALQQVPDTLPIAPDPEREQPEKPW